MTGEVIVIIHQHKCHGKNKTIHSFPQIEHHKNIVDNLSIKVGVGQHFTNLEKHKNPMSILGHHPT